MVYIEATAEVPEDLTRRLEELSDSLLILKKAEKEIKSKIDIKRGEFEMITEKYGVGMVETDTSTASVSTSERFSKWNDPKEVFNKIPRRLQTIKTMTPDIKKIRALVTSGRLPEDILDLAKMTTTTRMSFKPTEEE